MNNKNWLLVLIFWIGMPLLATSSNGFTPIEWEEERDRTQLDELQLELPEYIIYNGYKKAYHFEDDNLMEYVTIHLILYLNSEDAIQRNNRIEINMGGIDEITALQARTFSSTGSVFELNLDNVREIEDEDRPGMRLFALEGIDMGSEIEFKYTMKKSASIHGYRFFQFGIPVNKQYFELSAPAVFRFEMKAYNGEINKNVSLELSEDDNEDNSRIKYTAYAVDTEMLQEEAFSNYNGNRMRLEYKISQNLNRPGERFFTWDVAANRMYNSVHNITRQEERAATRFFRNIAIKGSTAEKIRAIENHIKDNIFYSNRVPDLYEDNLTDLLDRKHTGTMGFLRLFATAFRQNDIKYEVVITSNRFQNKFDGSFESWNYLDEYLFYFPEIDRFLQPDHYTYRNFLLSYYYTYTEALFIKEVSFRDQKSGSAYIDFIPAFSYSVNRDNLDIKVSFAEELNKNKVHEVRLFNGVNAASLQAQLKHLSESERKEVMENLTRHTAADAEILEWEIKNMGAENVNKEPLILDRVYETSAFIQQAGSSLIFNLGDLIGPQTEMYVDSERRLPVENTYLRGYSRKLTVNLPEGYTIQNPDDIVINEFYEQDGTVVFLFESEYTLHENVLEVKIEEYYNQMSVPADEYEGFRKVINAAADFNKISLILEKS